METTLEQCRRHVMESAKRIARHKVLIAEIERSGNAQMLKHAYSILNTLEQSQRLGEDHLVRELGKSTSENKS